MPQSACLIIAEDSLNSFSPAGERLRHMAFASGQFFTKAIVLTMGETRKQNKGVGPNVLTYTTGLVRTMPFPISALFDPIRFLFFFLYGFVLSLLYKPSYVAASMPPVETGISGLLLTKLLQKKLIIDYMDDWESAMISQLTRYIPETLMKPIIRFAKRIYSSSTSIFAATPTLATKIQQYGLRASVIMAPNGADTLVFFPRDEKSRREMRLKYALPLGKTVVAYCGNGSNPYYRIDLILSAAKSLSSITKKKIFFVFYLYGGIEYCRKIQTELRISSDLVEIREPLQRKNLSEAMAACDIGLVPFDDRSFLLYAMSTKIYEYLSAGLYVIGSGPTGGELDLFFSQNTYCGVFVGPRTEEFVHVFSKIVEDDAVLFEDSFRNLRHSFITENYDSLKIMKNAMAHLPS